MSDEKKIVRLVPVAERLEQEKEEIAGDDQKELIAYLGELLERARAGEFVGMVAIVDTKDNGFFKISTQSMLDNASQTIGELEIVKTQFIQAISDLAVEEGIDQ